mgnify:CR=1 FL=1
MEKNQTRVKIETNETHENIGEGVTFLNTIEKPLHLSEKSIPVNLTYGFDQGVSDFYFRVIFERMAYFQVIREIGHHNVRARRKTENRHYAKIVEWTNATQHRQLFMRVLCKIKMEGEHKSVGEVASLCNVSANAVREMIKEASELGFIERHPDTHHVSVNSVGIKIWHRYIESLYTEDETFIRQFFNTVNDYYRHKDIREMNEKGKVALHNVPDLSAK